MQIQKQTKLFTAQYLRLSQLALVHWAVMAGSFTIMLSLLTGVVVPNTQGFASEKINAGAKAFSSLDITNNEPAFKYEIQDDVRLNLYNFNVDSVNCANTSLSSNELISANSKIGKFPTSIVPDTCSNLNFNGSTIEPSSVLNNLGYYW